MKKALKMLFVSALAATLFTSVAFAAGIEVHGFGRGIFAPALSNKAGEVAPSRQTSWGDTQRVGLTFKGNDDNNTIGFVADVNLDDGSVGGGDQQYIYAKPMDMLEFRVGQRIFFDKYRGQETFGSWDWIRFTGLDDEDLIYKRMTINDGAALIIDPIANLTIYTGFGSTEYWGGQGLDGNYKAAVEASDGPDGTAGTADDVAAAPGEPITTAQMFALGHYGVGYEISGIGVFRAQYYGRRNMGADADYGVANAAFKLTMVQNLTVDLGAFFPTDSEQAGTSDWSNTQFSLGVKYAMGGMTFHVVGSMKTDKDYTVDGKAEEDATAMHFGLGLDYDLSGMLGDGMGLNADVRYSDEAWAAYKDGAIGFLVGVNKGFSNGGLGIGIQGTTGQFNGQSYAKENTDDFSWAVPVRAQYWF